MVPESLVTWATSVSISVFLGFSVLDLGPMYATDRCDADVRRQSSEVHHRLMAPTTGAAHNNINITIWRTEAPTICVESQTENNRRPSLLVSLHFESGTAYLSTLPLHSPYWPKRFNRHLFRHSFTCMLLPVLKASAYDRLNFSYYYYCYHYAPAPRVGGIKRWCASDENREAYRNTKIGTEVAHVTHDSDTTFKIKGSCFYICLLPFTLNRDEYKRSKVNLQGRGHIVAASRIAFYY